MFDIKSKFHENKDWNLQTGIVSAGHQFIKSKFHENKDWNSWRTAALWAGSDIKSKFHENKDWNSVLLDVHGSGDHHQEQVPRKQGLKLSTGLWLLASWRHQEQVPRKQGLKLISRCRTYHIMGIKSKFHENKDWNQIRLMSWLSWERTSRASSTKTRIETISSPDFLQELEHQEQVPRKQGLKLGAM